MNPGGFVLLGNDSNFPSSLLNPESFFPFFFSCEWWMNLNDENYGSDDEGWDVDEHEILLSVVGEWWRWKWGKLKVEGVDSI